jgi:hypothetical protein
VLLGFAESGLHSPNVVLHVTEVFNEDGEHVMVQCVIRTSPVTIIRVQNKLQSDHSGVIGLLVQQRVELVHGGRHAIQPLQLQQLHRPSNTRLNHATICLHSNVHLQRYPSKFHPQHTVTGQTGLTAVNHVEVVLVTVLGM